MDATYEELCEQARRKSLNGQYGAVVTVSNYRTGRSRTSVFGGSEPIRSRQVGPEFLGVECLFHDGRPAGHTL